MLGAEHQLLLVISAVGVACIAILTMCWLRLKDAGIQDEVVNEATTVASFMLLNHAFDQIQDSVILCDGQSHILYVNDGACRKLGYLRKELLGLTILDIAPELTPETWPRHWRELKAKRKIDTYNRTKSGSTFPVEANISIFEYEGRPYHLALVQDVTAHKQAETIQHAYYSPVLMDID